MNATVIAGKISKWSILLNGNKVMEMASMAIKPSMAVLSFVDAFIASVKDECAKVLMDVP